MKRFLDLIYKKSALQRKYIQNFLAEQDDLYWQRADKFADNLISLLDKLGLSIEYVTDSYLAMCKSMIVEQIKFKKSGKYTCQSASDAFARVYLSEQKMASYMYGLALSQFLWPNHYAMYDFFISESKKIADVKSYLEIGPGHGLFLVESIQNFSEANFMAIDISPVSKSISETIVNHFTGTSKCHFQVKDINHFDDYKFDYIVMCEVLEHLDEPQAIMKKIHKFLNVNGNFFITTCANCPAIDHVYQFQSVDHIRTEIHEAGFKIVSELFLPVGNLPESQWTKQQIEANYAAMLKKA